MNRFLEIYSQFYCHRFEIRMIAADDVVFDAWTGAVVRNNLLYAADKVHIETAGQTLREQLLCDKNETGAVHLAGEPVFCFLLAQLLLKENITCLVSTTERITTEKDDVKISEFRFGRFREYKLL